MEKQVAAAYYFADEGRMRKVVNSFGIGKSTVSKIIRHILASSKYLEGKYIFLHTNEKDIEEMASNFSTMVSNKHGFQQWVSVLDGTHVGVKSP